MNNHTLGEKYYGLTRSKVNSQLKQFRVNPPGPLASWNWKEHDIDADIIQKRVFLPLALSMVSSLRRRKPTINHRSAVKGRRTSFLKRNVYVLRNYDLSEMHYGVTRDSVHSKMKELRSATPANLAHWEWKTHDIDGVAVHKKVFAPKAWWIVLGLKFKKIADWKNI
jgi:hypothetical protein